MAKRKERIQNPEPFVPDGTESVKSKKRSKALKQHQKEGKLIDSNIRSKIMKEALIQYKEVQDEEERENNASASFFHGVEEPANVEEENDEDDIDHFAGFSETQSEYGGYEEDINEEDERIMEAFLSKEPSQQKSLADLIVERIKEKDVTVASDIRPVLKLDKSKIDIYKGVGTHLSHFTKGKLPKLFKNIPSQHLWEEILYITEPENWSPNAVYQATRIFASNFCVKKAERFYKLVVLPRVREDIRKNKHLHFALYQTLKKALYKPAAFFKGILFPLCESHTCTSREAKIIGSIIEKVSIRSPYSSVALLKLAGMEYCGTTSYFIKVLVEKKYGLPCPVVNAVVAHFMKFLDETRIMPVIWHQSLLAFVQSYFIKVLVEKKYGLPRPVVNAVVAHFMKFLEETRIMPVIWHQSLLAFVQRYKNELQKEDKDNLRVLLEKQKHKLVTPEISRELNHSRSRGEEEDDMLISSPVSVINKTIEEDRFDIPDVPMEED